jgi:hypothetical protein
MAEIYVRQEVDHSASGVEMFFFQNLQKRSLHKRLRMKFDMFFEIKAQNRISYYNYMTEISYGIKTLCRGFSICCNKG